MGKGEEEEDRSVYEAYRKQNTNITQIYQTSHTNISCINCKIVTVLPCGYGYIFYICHNTYMYMYTAFTQ